MKFNLRSVDDIRTVMEGLRLKKSTETDYISVAKKDGIEANLGMEIQKRIMANRTFEEKQENPPLVMRIN